MKTTMSAVYKMVVEGDCGCAVRADFSDPAYKDKVTEPIFSPCESHKDKPGIEFLSGVLGEALIKEAKEFKLPEVVRPRPVRTDVGDTNLASLPPVDGNGERRIAIPGKSAEKRTPGGTPKIVGSSTGVRRVNPNGMRRGPSASERVRTAQTSSAAARTAVPAAKTASMAIDLEPAAEDLRLTKALKVAGIEDIFEATDEGGEVVDGLDEGDDGDLDFDL